MGDALLRHLRPTSSSCIFQDVVVSFSGTDADNKYSSRLEFPEALGWNRGQCCICFSGTNIRRELFWSHL
eukprot:NODE_3728_length_348_cov_55.418060_g3646_i0.p2 GENE.NODE_3728_length_348_cov_55.418060_g3646_i0~~NODE_3728_length_348_cov_55.418060_g3646_i0.p2  ORF type:complete len:70 (-),score=1.95 NODE_3728_length_348_cov_55.418060_g3646_i0:106-315(-)